VLASRRFLLFNVGLQLFDLQKFKPESLPFQLFAVTAVSTPGQAEANAKEHDPESHVGMEWCGSHGLSFFALSHSLTFS
jgi:hypothetical protein